MSTPPTGPAPDLFESRLAQVRERQEDDRGRRHLWHAHHWPRDYGDHCVQIGSRHWCRRCLSLYPLGFLVAILSASGLPPWPGAADPAMIWLLCLPGTAAFTGEALGVLDYRPRWQMAATLITATAFGRALGYELVERWSAEFWGPVAVFGGIWFLASLLQHRTAHRRVDRPGP